MNWKHIGAFILGALLVIIYWQGCNPCPEIGSSSEKTKVVYKPGKTVRVVDSIYYKKYHELLDQIPTEKPLYSGRIPKRIQKKIDKEDSKNQLSKIRRFETPFVDSSSTCLINGKIISLVKGELLSSDFKWTSESLVVTDKSTTTDTIEITTTIENVVIKNHLWLGAETSVSPAVNHISFTLDFAHKKGWMVGYRYEKNFNYFDSHNVRLGKTIW